MVFAAAPPGAAAKSPVPAAVRRLPGRRACRLISVLRQKWTCCATCP